MAGEERRGRSRGRLLRRVFRWVQIALVGLVVLSALGLGAVALVIRRYEHDLPTVGDLRSYRPPQVSRVLARDGSVLGELFVERRTVVPIAEIPEHVRNAFLAAEDASFYDHAGLDYLGMLRAVWVNVRSGSGRQGASTITQQLVKNVLLTPERTFDRKVKEVILARRIEQELTKDEILEIYLNQIYFGHGRYGVEEAARYYFGKGVRELSLGEAAVIAAVVKGPSIYSPRKDVERATKRRGFVLAQLRDKGFASAADVQAAEKAPIRLAPERDLAAELAPEVVEEVRRQMKDLLGAEWERRGYTITTSIDPVMQAAGRSSLRKALDDWGRRHKAVGKQSKAKKEPAPYAGKLDDAALRKALRATVTGADDARRLVLLDLAGEPIEAAIPERYNPEKLAPSQWAERGRVLRVRLEALPAAPTSGQPKRPLPARLELGPEGALVAIDVASREVLAWVGGYEGVRASFDRASQAKRQPGSTMKTFVYAQGIAAKQLTAASLLETDPAALPEKYRPHNYDGSAGAGPVRLREALAQSVNVSAVWALAKVGPKPVAELATKMGIRTPLGADLSLALGSYEVTPLDLTSAYATIAAGGVAAAPKLVLRVTGPDGTQVPVPGELEPAQALDPAATAITTSLLRSVVDTGTARAAKSLGRPVAGKTGTSNQARDTWFVGFSPEVACGVWVGFDDPEPLGGGESGGVTALPAFVAFARQAFAAPSLAGKRGDFPSPPGVVRVRIDPKSGLLAAEGAEDAIDEVFVQGTEPTEVAAPPVLPFPFPTTEEGGGLPAVVFHTSEPLR
jgi:penicillin-binding protein 1A